LPLSEGQTFAVCGNTAQVQYMEHNTTVFCRHYLRYRSTSAVGVLVISVYCNLRNILPKSGTFPPGHCIYIYIYTYIYIYIIPYHIYHVISYHIQSYIILYLIIS
jgi:hypothetical protein